MAVVDTNLRPCSTLRLTRSEEPNRSPSRHYQSLREDFTDPPGPEQRIRDDASICSSRRAGVHRGTARLYGAAVIVGCWLWNASRPGCSRGAEFLNVGEKGSLRSPWRNIW
jgi:hypothetical protein